uniref:SAWADEE domain-containing protein n=1 Tax=Aegilops tauschii subsp. strangulata TaxID=200361 RepID=A0A453KN36_AEGTS
MEKLVSSDRKEQVLVDSFCQKLVEEFNRSPARVGSRALQATQVRGWFLDKLPASTPKPASLPTTSEEKPLASEPDALISEIKTSASDEEKVLALDTSISNNEDALSADLPKETTDKVPEFEDLQFEAKSSKDSAWYDVALFLAHRKTSLGEVVRRITDVFICYFHDLFNCGVEDLLLFPWVIWFLRVLSSPHCCSRKSG